MNALKGCAAVALAGIALACGSDEVETAGLEEEATPQSAALDSDDDWQPRLSSVFLEPDPPRAGDTVQASASLPVDAPAKVRLYYEWSLNGKSLPSKGDALKLVNARKGDLLELRVTPRWKGKTGGPLLHQVEIGNREPSLMEIAFRPTEGATAGSLIVAHPLANDADEDPLEFRYTWRVNGGYHDAEGNTLSTEDLQRGDTVQVEVEAGDGEDWSEPLLSQEITLANAAPRISTGGGLSQDAQGTLHLQVEAEDPDGDRNLVFSLLDSPPGMTIDSSSGAVAWRPSDGQFGRHLVKIKVDDRQGGEAISEFPLTVGAPGSSPAAPASR